MKTMIVFLAISVLSGGVPSYADSFENRCDKGLETCTDPFERSVLILREAVNAIELVETYTDNEDLEKTANWCEREYGDELRSHRQFFLDNHLAPEIEAPSEDTLVKNALKAIYRWVLDYHQLNKDEIGDYESTLVYFELSSSREKLRILDSTHEKALKCMERLSRFVAPVSRGPR